MQRVSIIFCDIIQLMKNAKAFTLIELMVVIAVIAILSGLAVVGGNFLKEEMKRTKVQADLLTIKVAAEKYLLEHGKFPTFANTSSDESLFVVASYSGGPMAIAYDINNSFLKTGGYIGNMTSPYRDAHDCKYIYMFIAAGTCFGALTVSNSSSMFQTDLIHSGVELRLYPKSSTITYYVHGTTDGGGLKAEDGFGITNCKKIVPIGAMGEWLQVP